MIGWISLIPTVLIMCLSWTACGFAMLVAVGIQQAKWYLASPAVACCFYGIVSLLTAVFRWSFLLLACCLLVALCIRLLLDKPLAKHFGFPTLKETVWQVATDAQRMHSKKACWALFTLVGLTAVTFVIVASSCGSTSLVIQGYDMPFHLSVVRHIIDTAHASPIGAGSVMGNPTAIYPDLWHANAALATMTFGLSIQQSAWVVLLAIVMFVLPCSIVLLVDVLFSELGGPSFCLVGLLAVCGVYSPISFMTFGPVLSNLYGLAILPAAIAFAGAGEKLRIPRASRYLCNLMMLGGLCFAHPNMAITYFVIILPLLIARNAGLGRKLAVICVYGIGWTLCLQSALFARTINCPDRTVESALAGEVICTQLGFDFETLGANQWFPLLASLVIIGTAIAIAAMTHKRWDKSWFLVSVSILMAQAVCSTFPENFITKPFTGFWYRDFYRLVTVCGFFFMFIVGALPELLARRLASSKTLKGSVGVTAAALVFALCGLKVLSVAKQEAKTHCSKLNHLVVESYSLDSQESLNAEHSEFCKRVKDVVGDSGVLNNYRDSSVWMYSLYNINAQLKGRSANQISPMSDELYTLVCLIDTYGTDSKEGEATRKAAKSLGVEYVAQMSDMVNLTTKFTPDGMIDYTIADAILRIDENTPGFDLVLEGNGMRLYKLAYKS